MSNSIPEATIDRKPVRAGRVLLNSILLAFISLNGTGGFATLIWRILHYRPAPLPTSRVDDSAFHRDLVRAVEVSNTWGDGLVWLLGIGGAAMLGTAIYLAVRLARYGGAKHLVLFRIWLTLLLLLSLVSIVWGIVDRDVPDTLISYRIPI